MPPGIDRQPLIRPDATYLVTGGLSGLGLEVARWVADQGARYLVLTGRRGATADAEDLLEALRVLGVDVRVRRCDVARLEDVDRVMREIVAEMPPLRGIVHSAGVIEDGIVANQSWESFSRVFAPKVDGAWHLHTQTRESDLDFFVLFSSLASLFGSAGQANYAAANSFLDGLAHERQRLGLPALSINWGAWTDIGMAARAPDRQRQAHAAAKGIPPLTPKDGLLALETLLGTRSAQIAVMPADWNVLAHNAPGFAERPIFSEMVSTASRTERPALARTTVVQATPAERGAVVFDYLRARVAEVLHVAAAVVDEKASLTTLGIDSLMAQELRTRFEMDLDVHISLTNVLKTENLGQLSELLVEQISAFGGSEDSVRPDSVEEGEI